MGAWDGMDGRTDINIRPVSVHGGGRISAKRVDCRSDGGDTERVSTWSGRYIKGALVGGGVAAVMTGTVAWLNFDHDDAMTRQWRGTAALLFGVMAMGVGAAMGVVAVRIYRAYVDWVARQ